MARNWLLVFGKILRRADSLHLTDEQASQLFFRMFPSIPRSGELTERQQSELLFWIKFRQDTVHLTQGRLVDEFFARVLRIGNPCDSDRFLSLEQMLGYAEQAALIYNCSWRAAAQIYPQYVDASKHFVARPAADLLWEAMKMRPKIERLAFAEAVA